MIAFWHFGRVCNRCIGSSEENQSLDVLKRLLILNGLSSSQWRALDATISDPILECEEYGGHCVDTGGALNLKSALSKNFVTLCPLASLSF